MLLSRQCEGCPSWSGARHHIHIPISTAWISTETPPVMLARVSRSSLASDSVAAVGDGAEARKAPLPRPIAVCLVNSVPEIADRQLLFASERRNATTPMTMASRPAG